MIFKKFFHIKNKPGSHQSVCFNSFLCYNIIRKDDAFERMEVNQLFSAAKLSKEQTNAVNELVLNDLDHRVFCKKYACSSKTAFKHRANGLQKLKLLLA